MSVESCGTLDRTFTKDAKIEQFLQATCKALEDEVKKNETIAG